MATSQSTAASPIDYLQLLKDSFNLLIKSENLVPLLVGMLAVSLSLFTVILFPPVMLGFVNTALKIARGEKARIEDLASGFQRFGAAFAMALVAGVLIALGFVLLVVPGVALAILFCFGFHALASDPDLGPGGALKESIHLVKANVVDVLVVWVIGGALSALLSWTVIGGIAAGAYTALLTSMLYLRMVRVTP